MASAIEFENVSKQYRLGLVSTGTLRHDINRWWQTSILGKEDPYLKIGETNDRSTKGNSEYVWALKDINFKVEQGDVVGIIGKNGAGKSTLLKLLSRVTGPTTGVIRAHGRIGSLLEVGTGFHGEMTGRENIFMNGAILGMTRHEIQAKLDEIIDFSGCERYIDTPVKRYSSGMTVRLGFAVAAFLDPEILVVDEVLAVGDAEFQKKAIGKMKDVSQGEGRTVLFVSHNMTSVKNLCNHGVLLENGMVRMIGDVEEVVNEYIHEEPIDLGYNLTNYEEFEGNGELRVGRIDIRSEGEPNGMVFNNKPVRFKIEILNPKRRNGFLEIAGALKTLNNEYILYYGSKLKSLVFQVPSVEKFYVTVDFAQLPLSPQKYSMGVELKLNNEFVYEVSKAAYFDVVDNDFYNNGVLWNKGLMFIDQDWKLEY